MLIRAGFGAALIAVLSGGVAHAQPAAGSCFTTAEGAAAPSVVGLDATVVASPDCRYSTTRDGAPVALPAEAAGHPIGFLELYAAVAGDTADSTESRARFVYARPATRRRGVLEADQSLALRFCVHFVMEEELGFRIRTGATDELIIERSGTPATDCGSARLDLRVLPLAADGAAPMILHGDAPQTLAATQRDLHLAHGSYAFYAARSGAPLALRVGQLASRGAHTPLRDHLRAAERASARPEIPGERPALLETTWSDDTGALLLRPARDARLAPEVWSEARTAAAAESLWLARRRTQDAAPRIIEVARVEPGGSGIRLPDDIVEEHLRALYGRASASLAPSLAEWRTVLDGLELCLAPTYGAGDRLVTGPVPAGSHCAPLPALAAVMQPATAAGGETPRLCIERGMQVMSAAAATRIAPPRPEENCLPLDGTATAPLLAIRGDVVRLRGATAGSLCVLLEGQPLDLPAAGAPLPRAGLVEVRAGAGAQCAARQGLALARLAVLDPEREWHPAGLYTSTEPARPNVPAWRRLGHDEDTVFAYTRSRQTLDFRLSTSPLLAAAVNTPDAPAALTQNVPALGGVTGTIEGAHPPLVFAYVSRDEACPRVPLERLRRRVAVDPGGLPVDATFHVFLAADEGPTRFPVCLARASFRVRASRIFLATTPAPALRIEAGLLGDVRAVVFFVRPTAIGVALPAAWLRLSLTSWLGFEFAAPLTFATTFEPSAISRAGVALSALMELGVPEIAPRLLGVGTMLHASGGNHPDGEPLLSFVVALNLSTLVDLAGGR